MKKIQYAKPQVELLETRLTPSTFRWLGNAGQGGDSWNIGTNWDNGAGVRYQANQVPTLNDSVLLDGNATTNCNIDGFDGNAGELVVTNAFTKGFNIGMDPVGQSGNLYLSSLGVSSLDLRGGGYMAVSNHSNLFLDGTFLNYQGGDINTTGSGGSLYLYGGAQWNCVAIAGDEHIGLQAIYVGLNQPQIDSAAIFNVATNQQDSAGNVYFWGIVVVKPLGSFFMNQQNNRLQAGNVLSMQLAPVNITNWGRLYFSPETVDTDTLTLNAAITNYGLFHVASDITVTINNLAQTQPGAKTEFLAGSTVNCTGATLLVANPNTTSIYIAAGEFDVGILPASSNDVTTINLPTDYFVDIAGTALQQASLVVGGSLAGANGGGRLILNGTLILEDNTRLVIYYEFSGNLNFEETTVPVYVTDFCVLNPHQTPVIEVHDMDANEVLVGQHVYTVNSKEGPLIQGLTEQVYDDTGALYGIYNWNWDNNPDGSQTLVGTRTA